MPFYEYECGGCGEVWTALRGMGERDQPVECPQCGVKDARRLISAFSPTGAAVAPGACPSGGPSGGACGASGFG